MARQDARCHARTGSGRRCTKSAEVFSGGNGRLCYQHRDWEPPQPRTPVQDPIECAWRGCSRPHDTAVIDHTRKRSKLCLCAEHTAEWSARYPQRFAPFPVVLPPTPQPRPIQRRRPSGYKPKPCTVCGKVFQPTASSAKYCTDACRPYVSVAGR